LAYGLLHVIDLYVKRPRYFGVGVLVASRVTNWKLKYFCFSFY